MENIETTFIIIGGTGDLAKRKLVPAISALLEEGTLSNNTLILGVSRNNLDDNSYKQFLIDSTSKNKEKRYLSQANIKFHQGDMTDINCFIGLKELLDSLPSKNNNHIFYLSISPSLIPKAIEFLEQSNLVDNSNTNKLILEKPIGIDLNSFIKIEEAASKVFSNKNIYRIDHYLGKEIIQNLYIFKFSNPFIEQVLNNKLVEKIELNIDEDLGVENRVEFYNESGAIKDIIQNHLLQTLALILMDLPSSLSEDKIKEEKIKVLKNLKVSFPEHNLLGQYKSYSKEAESMGIINSRTETLAKIRLQCDNDRWRGVNIILKTGKKLEEKKAKIEITFKKLSENYFHNLNNLGVNKLTLSIQPKEDLSLTLNVKSPNKLNEVEEVNFKMSNEISHEPNPSEGHVKLIRDAIKEYGSSLVSFEESKAAWEIIDSIEKMRNDIDFVVYDDYTNPENYS